MKKLILSTILLLALTFTTFAGEKNSNKQLLNDLTKAMNSSSSTKWITENNNKRVTFNFNGRYVSACFYQEDEFVGFSVPILSTELSSKIAETIAKKFKYWKISDAILFIDNSGDTNYFVQVERNSSKLALKVSLNGQTSIFSKF